MAILFRLLDVRYVALWSSSGRRVNRALPSIGNNLRSPGGHRYLTHLVVGRPAGRRGGTKFHFCLCRPIAAHFGDVPLAWDIGVAALQRRAVLPPYPCASTQPAQISRRHCSMWMEVWLRQASLVAE